LTQGNNFATLPVLSREGARSHGNERSKAHPQGILLVRSSNCVIGRITQRKRKSREGASHGLYHSLAINKQIGEHAKATWKGISPWWAALPVGLLVLWSLLRANFERFEEERKAKEIAEERERELLSARQLKQEWERLEGRFKQFPAKLLAGWSHVVPIVDDHAFSWFLLGGDSERNAKELMVVIEEAGNLLKTSHFAMNQFP
jgi:hypothetical protein